MLTSVCVGAFVYACVDCALQVLSAAKKKEEARQRIEDAKKAKLAAQSGETVDDEETVAELLKPSKKGSMSGKSPRAQRVDAGEWRACVCARVCMCVLLTVWSAEAAIKGVDLDALLANPAPGESKKSRAKKAAAAAEGGEEAEVKPKSSSSRRRVGKDEGVPCLASVCVTGH